MATTRQLPAVRLPPTLGPSADILVSDKFTVLAAGDPKASPKRGTGAGPQPDAHHDLSFPWSADDNADHASDTTPMNDPPSAPRLARAFSTPLPEQLGHLKHPHRSPSATAALSSDARIRNFNDISIELADSVQLAIQTLLQLVPPHLLDSAKEQYAACAVQVPTASVSALLTFMKNLNYMSANMSLLSASSDTVGTSTPSQHADFDVGELLQNVGDSLGGLAASAGVELVLFHADVGMKHISVHTDECGLSYALTYAVRQVLDVCRPGDTVELGLQIVTAGSQTPSAPGSTTGDPSEADPPSPASSATDLDGPLHLIFEITHRYGETVPVPYVPPPALYEEHAMWPPQPEHIPEQSEPPSSPAEPASTRTDDRKHPDFRATIFRRLLQHIGGTLTTVSEDANRHVAMISLAVPRGDPLPELANLSAADEAVRQPFPDLRLASEPTLAELQQFTETLRGNKVLFHASSTGSFARHLSSYLTSWGLDVSHVPTDDAEGALVGLPFDNASVRSDSGDVTRVQDSAQTAEVNGAAGDTQTFIVIDDDVHVLRRRLMQLRQQVPRQRRQRPALAVHHRPRSSGPARTFSSGLPQINEPDSAMNVVIIHFASLANYKVVKDMLQSTLSTPNGGGAMYTPEVLVVLKPAGPRRFLTALYTAVHKPIVDPFFMPIATSPASPAQVNTPYSTVPPSLRHRSSASTTASAGGGGNGTGSGGRSPRAGSESAPMQPQTPLAMDGIEYFSETAAAQTGETPATGVWIQSPDGRPTGIFFQPQPRRRTSEARRRNVVPPGTQITHIPLDPTKMIRRFNQTPSPFSLEAQQEDIASSGDDAAETPSTSSATIDDKPSAAALSKPLPLSQPGSPGPSAMQTPRRSMLAVRRSSAASSVTSTAGSTSPTESIIGRYARTTRSPVASPVTGMPLNDAAQALARFAGPGAPNRKSSAQLTESPTTPRNPPLITQTSASSVASSSRRGTGRKSLDGGTAVPVAGASTAESGTNAAPTTGASATSPTASKIADKPKKAGAKPGQKGNNDIVPPVSVLIVEDNPINRNILSHALTRMGVKHSQAGNGQEALDMWRKGNFHLILMDIHMPVMDGITATREIRRCETGNVQLPMPSPSLLDVPPPDSGSGVASPSRSSVIIVALTASNLESDRLAALAAGCNDYITKPVSLAWLRQKIMEWGSIKMLQSWASDVPIKFQAEQDQKAQDIAAHLKLPRSRGASPVQRPVSPLDPSEVKLLSVVHVEPDEPPSSPTRSISPPPVHNKTSTLGSASEESLVIPPTPEDDERTSSPQLVERFEVLTLEAQPGDGVPIPPSDATIRLNSFSKNPRRPIATAQPLPGALPATSHDESAPPTDDELVSEGDQ